MLYFYILTDLCVYVHSAFIYNHFCYQLEVRSLDENFNDLQAGMDPGKDLRGGTIFFNVKLQYWNHCPL